MAWNRRCPARAGHARPDAGEAMSKEADRVRCSVRPTTMRKTLARLGLSLKKTAFATEQKREDIALERANWAPNQAGLDIDRIVFSDETSASTNMTPIRGRLLRGTRCIGRALFRSLVHHHLRLRVASRWIGGPARARWPD